MELRQGGKVMRHGTCAEAAANQEGWHARHRALVPALHQPRDGKERTDTFRLKLDAERRLTDVEASKLTGSYVDPRAGKVTLRTWAERWLDVQVRLKPTTRARCRSILDVHTNPRWGEVELARVRHADVQKWVAQLSAARSAATVRMVHRVLSQVLGSAVKRWPSGAQRRRGHHASARPVEGTSVSEPQAGSRARRSLRGGPGQQVLLDDNGR